jgi:hypothetical protein
MSDTPPDLTDAEQALRAVSEASLRLMAGSVSKPTMVQMRRVAEQSDGPYPWQEITQGLLAEDVDEQRLVQQGLTAQRDWILRGGRQNKAPGIGRRAKGMVATLLAQLIFVTILAVLILISLLILKYKLPEWDIYRITEWVQDLFGS